MSCWGMTWRTGRTCKFRCDESWTKAKAEIWLPLLDRGSIELGCDALAGSFGIDRFLQVCDRVYFPLLGTRECL